MPTPTQPLVYKIGDQFTLTVEKISRGDDYFLRYHILPEELAALPEEDPKRKQFKNRLMRAAQGVIDDKLLIEVPKKPRSFNIRFAVSKETMDDLNQASAELKAPPWGEKGYLAYEHPISGQYPVAAGSMADAMKIIREATGISVPSRIEEAILKNSRILPRASKTPLSSDRSSSPPRLR